MANTQSLRDKMKSGAPLAGTFVKTPHISIIEVLAASGLDFLCLDAEHAPFDKAALDSCIGIGRALGIPMLVRVASSAPSEILAALDMGADGVVVPHVDSAQKAADVARAARFGHGGRGYAGSTRWAGYGTSNMPALLARSAEETVVIAQIEEPEGVEACEAIAATAGIDGLFIGPSDLTISYGLSTPGSPELIAAMARVGKAAKAEGKTYVTWVANAAQAQDWSAHGFTMFFVASEHAWMLAGARVVAEGVQAIKS